MEFQGQRHLQREEDGPCSGRRDHGEAPCCLLAVAADGGVEGPSGCVREKMVLRSRTLSASTNPPLVQQLASFLTLRAREIDRAGMMTNLAC